MLNFIFPKQDLNSKRIGTHLDKNIKQKFVPHEEICFKCKKYSKGFITHKFCNKNISKLVTCFYYTKEFKKYILAFKYYHRKKIILDLVKLMNIYFNIYLGNFKKEETIITFVPMHWIRKYFIKGYNQSELLAKELGKLNDIKVKKIFSKIKYTRPQAKIKDRKQRLINLDGSFKLNNIPEYIKNIVIVDDIITTGTTIEILSKIIKEKYYDKNIYSIVLARK